MHTPANVHQTMSKIEKIIEKAAQQKVDFIVFPELFLTGYDLPYHHIFGIEDDCIYSLCKIAKRHNISFLIGLPLQINDKVYISALYIDSKGEIKNKISKNYLYGIENDFFAPGTEAEVIVVKGFRIGVGVCFDSAHQQHLVSLKNKGMDIFIGSSLYSKGEGEFEMIRNYSQISIKHNILSAVVNYANKTGDWISCSNSSFYDNNGKVFKNLSEGKEELLTAQIQNDGSMCKYI